MDLEDYYKDLAALVLNVIKLKKNEERPDEAFCLIKNLTRSEALEIVHHIKREILQHENLLSPVEYEIMKNAPIA